MRTIETVVITGASGNLGGKLRQHWAPKYTLRLLDRNTRGDSAVHQADIGFWNESWVEQFEGADALVHLAADGIGCFDKPKLKRTNFDGTINVFKAALQAGVRRIVFASSSHVMGKYKYTTEPAFITTDLETRPGGRFIQDNWRYDSTEYATAKVFGEQLGKLYSQENDIEVVVVRIGFIQAHRNAAEDFPIRTDEWLKQLWMSNRDFCNLMDRCLIQELPQKFVVVHGISRNVGSCWDLESTESVLNFEAIDGLVVNPLKIRQKLGYGLRLQTEIAKLIFATK